jgi:hypothetical protein
MANERQNILTALRVGAALIIATVVVWFPLNYLGFFTYDMRFRLNPFSQKSSAVATIAVDQTTLEKFGGEPTLKEHTVLLKKLLKQNPILIYYVLDPKTLKGSAEDRLAFTETLKKFRNHILYMKELPNKGEESKVIVGKDFPGLKYSPGYLSTDFQHYAEDNVARRALLYAEGYVYSQVKAANLIHPRADFSQYRGSFKFGGS